MTMPAWPFALVHPTGYSTGIVPTAAELQLLQQQLAVAADGRTYTDVATLRNARYLTNSTFGFDSGRFDRVIRDPVTRRWVAFGPSGGPIISCWSINAQAWTSVGAIGGATSLTGVAAAHANNAGVILAGAAPGSATASKLVESTDGASSWPTHRSIGSSDTQAVSAITYSETLGLWLCSIGGVGGDGIYSSADRATWTLRTSGALPPQYFAVRETPSVIILANALAFAGSTTSYRRSVDGITWTLETFPENVSVARPTWNDALGKFFMSGATGVWSSLDATAGSWTKVHADTQQAALGSFGRILVRGDGTISLDGGVTWSAAFDINAQTDWKVATTPTGVALYRAATRELFVSPTVGF